MDGQAEQGSRERGARPGLAREEQRQRSEVEQARGKRHRRKVEELARAEAAKRGRTSVGR